MAYSIQIVLDLHKGTQLTPEQMSTSKCNGKYYAIKKAYSDFMGTQYKMPEQTKKPEQIKKPEQTKKTTITKKGGQTKKTRKRRFI